METMPTLSSSKKMIQLTELNQLFDVWSRVSYSRVLNVDQRDGFILEFVVDSTASGSALLEGVRNLTTQKHPAGNISFVSYYQSNSQYRIYRIEFIDPTMDKPDDYLERLHLYVESLKEIIKQTASRNRTSSSRAV